MFMRHAALVIAVLLPLVSLRAQDTSTRRPVVGIALSGGGALGLAHIGVLRYLEEHRIPVDRVAGTSMGGLIGGMYATGHNPAYLEKMVYEADWSELLSPSPLFEDRSVAEKQDWNRITGPYAIQLVKGFTLPAGLNTGRSLVLLLSGETAAYADVQDFDDLPIPFRCVATDLLAGEAFVLGEGYLPRALRATMALPGIFTPIEWDGRILSDGGIVNNLPTDVAKAMGADLIIGVTLRIAPSGPHELTSLMDVMRQSVNVAVVQNELRNIPLADIEITVQLGNHGSMDFGDAQWIIDQGYKAAAANQMKLEKLSISPQEWEEYLRARKARERTLPFSGPLVEVSSPQPNIQKNAARELSRKTGLVASRRELEDNLSGLLAATGLPTAFYGWRRPAGSPDGFAVELDPRRNAEVLLSPYFFYQLSPNEPGRPALRLIAAAILRDAYKSRFLAAMTLGDNPSITTEYYHPFDGSAYFIAPGFSLDRTDEFIYTGDSRIEERRDRFSGSFYFGMGTWRHLQLRMGAQAGFDKYSTPIGVEGFQATNTGFVNPEVKGIINSQDSAQLPSRGFRLNAAAGYSFREHSFPYIQSNFDHFHRIRNLVSLFALGQADTSLGRRLTFYDQFFTGGLTELDAFRYQELRGDTVLRGGGGILYRGANPSGASFRPIFGAWYQGARLKSFEVDATFKQSATIGMFVPTPVSLIGLTFSSDLNGSTRFRLSIGSFWNRP